MLIKKNNSKKDSVSLPGALIKTIHILFFLESNPNIKALKELSDPYSQKEITLLENTIRKIGNRTSSYVDVKLDRREATILAQSKKLLERLSYNLVENDKIDQERKNKLMEFIGDTYSTLEKLDEELEKRAGKKSLIR